MAVKLIMIMAGEELNEKFNLGAYVNYLKEKKGSNRTIEKAIQSYEDLSSSGRLVISDKMPSGEDLTSIIGHISNKGDIGAVFVDYIQKIPLQKSQTQRYLDIKGVSEMLLKQAVTHNLPVLLGAQLGRDQGTRNTQAKIRLDNLRESGDIEQDANLVLGLYNEVVEKMEDGDAIQHVREDLQIYILKNRGGTTGKKISLTFNRPVLTIKDKQTSSTH